MQAEGLMSIGLHAILIATVSLLVGAMILLLHRLFPQLSGGLRTLQAVQTMHTRPTPRLGGVAILIALAASFSRDSPTVLTREISQKDMTMDEADGPHILHSAKALASAQDRQGQDRQRAPDGAC